MIHIALTGLKFQGFFFAEFNLKKRVSQKLSACQVEPVETLFYSNRDTFRQAQCDNS